MTISLGRTSEPGVDHKKKVVTYIKSTEKFVFAPNRTNLNKTAYNFVEKLGLQYRFSKEVSAGDELFNGFIRRHKDLSIQKSEGLSVVIAQEINGK